MFGPLEVLNPELPLLYVSVPLYERLLGSLNCMNVWDGLLELFLSVPLPPLGEENTQGLSFKHALEHKFVDSGGKAILDVVCEACEGFFVHDIIGIGSQTHYKVMLIWKGWERLFMILEVEGMRFDAINQNLTIKVGRDLGYLFEILSIISIWIFKFFEESIYDSLRLNSIRGPCAESFPIRDEAHLSSVISIVLLIECLTYLPSLSTVSSQSLCILLHHKCLMYVVLNDNISFRHLP